MLPTNVIGVPPVAILIMAWLELTTAMSASPFFNAATDFSLEPGSVQAIFKPLRSKIAVSRAMYIGNLLMFQGG